MKKRLFAVAVTALFPAFAMLGYNEFANRQQRAEEVRQDVLSSSHLAASEMERIIDGVGSLLSATSAISQVVGPDHTGCAEVLARVVKGTPSVRTILLFNLDGTLICDNAGVGVGVSFADRDYFKQALAGKQLVVGGFTRSRITDEQVLPVALPVHDDNNAVTGVIAAGIRLDWLSDRLKERGLDNGDALTIADRDGVIVARQPFPDRFIGTRIPEPYMPLVRGDRAGTMEVVSQDSTVRVLGYLPAPLTRYGLYISSGVSMAAAFEPINRATAAAVLSIIAGAALSFSAAWFIGSTFIRRPIRHIVATLQRWRNGAGDARTGMRAEDGELEVIGQAVDQLLAELSERQAAAAQLEAHREMLMRELGHRVKNTLSIAIGIANQMFKAEPAAAAAFSQRLRALAGAYDLLLTDDWNSADIRDVVARSVAPHVDAVPDRFRPAGPSVVLPSQLVLSLSLVLHELATNAVKHGALTVAEGWISIEWQFTASDRSTVRLRWQEHDGPPVSSPNREGFGSKLLRRAFSSQFESEISIDFAADGLKCCLQFSVADPKADSDNAVSERVDVNQQVA